MNRNPEISNEVKAKAEKAGRKIKWLLDAAKANDWTEFKEVDMSPGDVQYLNDEQKGMIAEIRTFFEQAKPDKEDDDEGEAIIEKVLSNFETALKNLE